METKINIAEILKDKPKEIKLYADAFGELSIRDIDVKSEPSITLLDKSGCMLYFYSNGKYSLYGEPILVPSKEMRDWSKFAWKKGDLLVNSCGFQCIFKEWASNDYTKFNGCYSNSRDGYEDISNARTDKFDKLDNNVAYSYVREIERKLGGKLNLETLKIEKPEFKDGDIVFVGSPMLGIDTNFMIAIFRKEKGIGKYKFSPALYKSNEHDTYLRENPVVLSPSDIKTFRLATDEEKQQLFDVLVNINKALDAEKKQVVDLKPKIELKPFDKVLVRDSKSDYWLANFFSHIDKDGWHNCVWACWHYCIPYEGNESLLGTTKDVEG